MNYAEIKTLTLSYADRQDDLELSDALDGFISVVTSRINRQLRTTAMAIEATIHVTSTEQSMFGLPEKFGGIRDIEVIADGQASGITAAYVNPEQMNNADASTGTYYTIVANQIQMHPALSKASIKVVYYRLLDDLVEPTDTNWLSEINPDVYIFGLMVEVLAFVKNFEGSMMWEQRFSSAVGAITEADQTDRWSGTPLTIRIG